MRPLTILRTFSIAAAIVVLGIAVSIGAPPADPVVGTWKLNLDKSTYSPGPPPKSETRTYEGNTETNTVSWTGINAAGTPVSGHNTYGFDGKYYPITGSADFDSISLKRVDRFTVDTRLKKDGKVVGTTHRVVSQDGKVMTLTSKVTKANSVVEAWVRVYDRQQ
jgi:hypothetical protein